jgi:hypothetical protein
MTSTSETVLVTAECLCKAHTFSTKVPTSKLPLQAVACHCDSCRYSTGALYSIDIPWPEPRKNVDTTKLKKYPFSSNIGILFCGTCSTPMFFEHTKEPYDIGVFTGALKNLDVDLVNIKNHIYVGDTVDGGATMWLRKPNADGSEAPKFKERDDGEEYPLDWPSASVYTGYEKKTDNKSVAIRCHCKGVDFQLHRGNYEGKSKDEIPWFIDPKTYKPIANFDACDSCRLQSGIDIFHWTFAELVNLSFNKGDKPFPKHSSGLEALVDAKDAAVGTLAYYKSSPDVHRYFCSVCSATVFYNCDDRSDMLDVAVGLLDAPDGARAEGFLSWALGGPAVWVNDTKGGWREGLFKRVQEEAEDWRIERGYPKNWRRVLKEEEKKE